MNTATNNPGPVKRASVIGRIRRFIADRRLVSSSGIFDAPWYRENNPDVAMFRADALTHFLLHGGPEGRDPSPVFDSGYYLSQVPGDRRQIDNALVHYLREGWQQGLDPNRIFDTRWYLEHQFSPGTGGMSPLQHYLKQAAPYPHDPGPGFSNKAYLQKHPAATFSGVNPGWHHLAAVHGRTRNFSAAAGSPPLAGEQVSYRIDCNRAIGAGDDVLVYVAYSPSGKLSALQRRELGIYLKQGYKLVLVVNTSAFGNWVDPGSMPVAVQIVRENVGYDFGAWRHAVELVGGLASANSVSFTNDSVVNLSPEGGAGPVGLASLVEQSTEDVVFLTRNREFRPHHQSYFFCLRRPALARGALALVQAIPYFRVKQHLINNVELKLSDKFAEAGNSLGTLFGDKLAETVDTNLTITHWRELLAEGFPFFKLQAISAGILSLDDELVRDTLGPELTALVGDHLQQRNPQATVVPPAVDANAPPLAALDSPALFSASGALQAYNPVAAQTHTFCVPFEGVEERGSPAPDVGKVLGIIHCFYLDVAGQILAELATTDLSADLLLTTDTQEKAEALRRLMAEHGFSGDVEVTPNRGRDVAPMLVAGADRIDGYDIFFHLHTKKSTHDDRYAGWGEFLRENLLHSSATVKSILYLLAEDDVGLVYSDHFKEVVELRNWGFDYQLARRLLARMGIDIAADELLDFPTSTMFWARTDALKPLFDLALDYSDFEEEAGQVDGTLAHAIERCLLYITEQRGYRHVKVVSTTNDSTGNAMSLDLSSIRYALRRLAPRLLGGSGLSSAYNRAVPEIYPVNVSAVANPAARLNIVIPTLKPEKIFGGISSALEVARNLFESMDGRCDEMRFIVTSDDVDAASLAELGRRMGTSVTLVDPNLDPGGNVVVDMYGRRHLPLALRAGDLFFCTAWWTADLGFRLQQRQQELYQLSRKVVYLVQDFEPGFYPWSEQYALAECTYRRPEETIAIINSEELANFMIGRYTLPDAFHLPYAINPQIASALVSIPKKKQILVYGRPSVARNLFYCIVEGLRVWQARDPQFNCEFALLFAGETFEQANISELENARVLGKLSLDEYAQTLSESAMGISLMVSPHPSYPPLEMASAGCLTISNNYEGKKIAERSDCIVALDRVTPGDIADALESSAANLQFDTAIGPGSVKPVATAVPAVDFSAIVKLLQL